MWFLGVTVKLTKPHCPRCTALAFDDLTLEEREDPEKLAQIVVTADDPEQNFCKGGSMRKKGFQNADVPTTSRFIQLCGVQLHTEPDGAAHRLLREVWNQLCRTCAS